MDMIWEYFPLFLISPWGRRFVWTLLRVLSHSQHFVCLNQTLVCFSLRYGSLSTDEHVITFGCRPKKQTNNKQPKTIQVSKLLVEFDCCENKIQPCISPASVREGVTVFGRFIWSENCAKRLELGALQRRHVSLIFFSKQEEQINNVSNVTFYK